MPEYLFSHPRTKRIISIVQKVNDVHEYIDKRGVKWVREFTVPQAHVDSFSNVDINSPEDFAEKTRNKKGKLGDLEDAAKEGSEKRKAKYGRDPMLDTYYKNWSKKRAGRKHPEAPKGTYT